MENWKHPINFIPPEKKVRASPDFSNMENLIKNNSWTDIISYLIEQDNPDGIDMLLNYEKQIPYHNSHITQKMCHDFSFLEPDCLVFYPELKYLCNSPFDYYKLAPISLSIFLHKNNIAKRLYQSYKMANYGKRKEDPNYSIIKTIKLEVYNNSSKSKKTNEVEHSLIYHCLLADNQEILEYILNDTPVEKVNSSIVKAIKILIDSTNNSNLPEKCLAYLVDSKTPSNLYQYNQHSNAFQHALFRPINSTYLYYLLQDKNNFLDLLNIVANQFDFAIKVEKLKENNVDGRTSNPYQNDLANFNLFMNYFFQHNNSLLDLVNTEVINWTKPENTNAELEHLQKQPLIIHVINQFSQYPSLIESLCHYLPNNNVFEEFHTTDFFQNFVPKRYEALQFLEKRGVQFEHSLSLIERFVSTYNGQNLYFDLTVLMHKKKYQKFFDDKALEKIKARLKNEEYKTFLIEYEKNFILQDVVVDLTRTTKDFVL